MALESATGVRTGPVEGLGSPFTVVWMALRGALWRCWMGLISMVALLCPQTHRFDPLTHIQGACLVSVFSGDQRGFDHG